LTVIANLNEAVFNSAVTVDIHMSF